jgi:hypothetical protein
MAAALREFCAVDGRNIQGTEESLNLCFEILSAYSVGNQ